MQKNIVKTTTKLYEYTYKMFFSSKFIIWIRVVQPAPPGRIYPPGSFYAALFYEFLILQKKRKLCDVIVNFDKN